MGCDVVAAADFIWREARLLDRRRWEYATGQCRARDVVAVLAGYQNADGGFGNALEPDLRTPTSQPVAAQVALELLTEVNALRGSELLEPLVAWCTATADSSTGGLPFVLPTALTHPRAPWWEPEGTPPPPSINPTAAIVGLFHASGLHSPWLDRASTWVMDHIEEHVHSIDGHGALCAAAFLEHVPERARAERVAHELAGSIQERGAVLSDPAQDGYGVSPLWLAPGPGSFAASWFAPNVLDRFLDDLEHGQQDDGGWPLRWDPPSQGARSEWRGAKTVDNIRTLDAYGRLDIQRWSGKAT